MENERSANFGGETTREGIDLDEGEIKLACEPGDTASDGGYLLLRARFGNFAIDVWRTKRNRYHVVRATSDVSGKILGSYSKYKEAHRDWYRRVRQTQSDMSATKRLE